ncbi:urea ABC transporter ATP-binding subunit UrtE [Pseudosulfitobacter pseudonitzschiae]|uniref:urea ABC transporter ATP-binding subunit UrtE n=1 Tax=Pseudosulfitobacter pseudonitzschiae TaxID=1402135 RepID=UPI001AFAE6D6|nr:urea ABC transporter ATP-binding subunit UrtE [Pseudosulfitobacter pseudonitzschiae]MBM1813875.1 urea ABC transporter ATP-binding subunit UrtE [Pseudosulfitobacter pseudonitzschiae]MBM1830868.1 urea ABC transporter ATP-binding subunit UrtE [Pseudosulfitobacter pseudonitzschiae]MBM1835735.1 urea ABC transporter ATP-binding subunit UrtE [Pseudosulfitobacter pseudonitzschiae]MBM1840581.1 urea ABC transporter ATP-binding subunit UrtE [Pseudosulfitobacter pseudonitzschiae]MBM1845431.1 urea ABC t
MLSLNDLTLHYGHSQILNGISMQAAQGEVTCVMGTNGVGKTSLIKAISGTHPRTAGTLSLDGQDLPVLPAHKLAHLGVAYVPQGREIFPLMTVKENLETGFVCLPPDEHFIPDHIYDLFPVLKDMTSRRGGDLSGGQQQQLAIARALITKPKLLLLDEPTEGIQPNIIQQIGNVIRLLRDQGEMAIVLVEQYFEFAYDLADRFVVLRRGAVVLEGAKADVPKADVLRGVSV